MIRPGIWPSGAKAPRLRRTAGLLEGHGAAHELLRRSRCSSIDSLDDWARGTAIEPSNAWPSHSGFGKLPRRPACALPRARAARRASHRRLRRDLGCDRPRRVGRREPGSGERRLDVVGRVRERPPPTGRRLPPAPVAASSSPKPATTTLTGLAPATTYHARVVVASAAGVVASDDATFTTLAEARAMRVAAAGDIACDPDIERLQRRRRDGHGVSPGRGLQRDPRRRLRRRARARRHAVQQRYGQPVRRLLRSELGPLPGDHPPRGRQSRVRQPERRALLRVLRRGGR